MSYVSGRHTRTGELLEQTSFEVWPLEYGSERVPMEREYESGIMSLCAGGTTG
jgi:hypothetical protein